MDPRPDRPNDQRYLALYVGQQAERIRLTIAELAKWAEDLERTAEKLEEKQAHTESAENTENLKSKNPP